MMNETLELLIEQDKKLIKKWKHLLENVNGSTGEESFHNKRTLARILDEEERYLKGKFPMLNEETMTGDIATFQKYALPLIRRIYPTLPINDLVGIQPLTGPAGLIFTLEALYGSNKGGVTKGETIYNNASNSYASQLVDGESLGTTSGTDNALAGTLAWVPAIPDSVTVVVTAGTLSVVVTDNGTGTISGTSTGGDTVSGLVNYAYGTISLTTSIASSSVAATYSYNMEANTEIPEVELDISEIPVVAKPRKLRAKWSPEAQQDLQAVHGVDGEATFIAEIAQAIQREISRAVVDLCISLVQQDATLSWSKARPTYLSYDEHKRTIIDQMIAISNIIYAKTYRGTANVAVLSTSASNVVETLPGFRSESADALIRPNGKIGTLNNRWTILKDVFMKDNTILMAYKGSSFMDVGVVYSPYIALMLDTFINPDDFKIRKGFMTRDALTAVNPKFYGQLNLTGSFVAS